MNLEFYLKKYFNYNEFRYPQKELIKLLLANKNLLVSLPTGSGKSIIFQLAGL
ncbi:protein containing DNA/RNA helicase, DEAD/DEAH box type, partial [gut metagenome]